MKRAKSFGPHGHAEVQGRRDVLLFVQAIRTVDRSFADDIANHPELKPSLEELIKRFKLKHQQEAAVIGSSQSAFANFMNRDEDGNLKDSKVKKDECGVCGSQPKHLWQHCPAINPLRRTAEYVHKPEYDEKIENIKKNPKLKGPWKRAW